MSEYGLAVEQGKLIARISELEGIAKVLAAALRIQHENCLYCKHYGSHGCVATHILAISAGLLDEPGSTHPPP